MTVLSVCQRLLLLLPLAIWLSGCSPSPTEDEEKDPYYLTGVSRYSNMDYDGAIAAFENALTVNPKSAAAHLQLGFLYEDKKSDFAAAIYHFEKHLELKPDSRFADTAKDRILSCKQELARTVSFALVSKQVQEDIRRLTSTNALLNDTIKQLKAELIEQAATYSNRLAMANQATQVALATPAQPQIPPEPEHRTALQERPPAPVGSNATARPAAAPKTYVIRPGDSLAKIARRYNISLSALQAVNPRVEPHRLKVGQTINLPGGRD